MKDVIDESLLQQPSLPEMLSCSVRVLEEKIEGMFSESGERLTHRDIFRGIIYICIPFLKISVTVLPLFLHARLSGLVDGESWEFALTWTQIPKAMGMTAWDALCSAQEAECGAGQAPEGVKMGMLRVTVPQMSSMPGGQGVEVSTVPFCRRKLA